MAGLGITPAQFTASLKEFYPEGAIEALIQDGRRRSIFRSN